MTDDPVLRSYRAALEGLYGDRLDRVMLFGSRARGDHHDKSDYDVAIFLKSISDRWPEFHRLADLRIDFLVNTGEFFNSMPFATSAYAERTPLMGEIRRDGVEF